MLKRFVAFLAVPTFAVALASAAFAQDPTDEIPLEGTWAIGDAQACDDPTSERLTFDASGTFTAEQGGEPTATGFWQLADDKLDLHMVSSPAFFDDQLQPFVGQVHLLLCPGAGVRLRGAVVPHGRVHGGPATGRQPRPLSVRARRKDRPATRTGLLVR